ncbi:MAG: hypothetical protein H6618_10340 [Deltaproteobacteria bacterium]|nr:hypothetical protein [Deltaproteobacteria bacterium]
MSLQYLIFPVMIAFCLQALLVMATDLPDRNSAQSCLRPYLNRGPEEQTQVPWEHCIGRVEDKQALSLLKKGQYQEAAWTLDEGNTQTTQEQAELILWFLETLMRDAAVGDSDISKLGMGGATKPMSVILPLGVHGVFKKKRLFHPSSSYRSEIAAYRLDRLFRFRLVPMTIKRHIAGHKGSLQYFIRGAKTASHIHGYRKSPNLNVFDYLIRNRDRNSDNILITKGREIAIDHGLCLRRFSILGCCLAYTDQIKKSLGVWSHPVRQHVLHPSTHIREFVASGHILRKMERILYHDLHHELSDLISKHQIAEIEYRKTRLLDYLYKAGFLRKFSGM